MEPVNVFYVKDPIVDPVIDEEVLTKLLGKLPPKPQVHFEPVDEAVKKGRFMLADEIVDGKKTGKKIAVPFKPAWKLYTGERERLENVPYGAVEHVAFVNDKNGLVTHDGIVHMDGRLDKSLGWKSNEGVAVVGLEYRKRKGAKSGDWWAHFFLQHRTCMDDMWTVGIPGGYGTSVGSDGTARMEIKEEFGDVVVTQLVLDVKHPHWSNRAITLNGHLAGYFTFKWGHRGAVRELEQGEDITGRFAIKLRDFTSSNDDFIDASIHFAKNCEKLGLLKQYQNA